MCRLQATRLWVGGGGFGVPRQQFGAESIQLPPANLADEVVLLEGILLKIVILLWPVAVVVDVLLLPLDPGRAQQVGPAATKNMLRSSGRLNNVRPGYSPSTTS